MTDNLTKRVRVQNAYQFRRFGRWRFPLNPGEIMPTGQVAAFAGTIAPSGWLLCDGTVRPVAGFAALVAVIGGLWGGNGVTTFGVPDLRGRVPLGAGQGAGLTNRILTNSLGEESHQLSAPELPAHAHTLSGLGGNAYINGYSTVTLDNPVAPAVPNLVTGSPVDFGAGPGTDNSGSGQLHNNMQPSLTLNYIIKT